MIDHLATTATRCAPMLLLAAICFTGQACEIQYHTEDWSEPRAHGQAAIFQQDDCQTCHGEDLTGGSSQISCDKCHSEGWRDDCTYCHGGGADNTGAPPGTLAGDLLVDSPIPRVHLDHKARGAVAEIACDECHKVPEGVLSPGHAFDPTPGVAEVVFGGINSAGRYDLGTCSDTYCHGTGRRNGSISINSTEDLGCDGCHAYKGLDGISIGTMSGRHSRHLRETGIECEACHSNVVDGRGEILDASVHVNGTPDIQIKAGLGVHREGESCQGTCHEHEHKEATWFGSGDSPHPPEWFQDETIHGVAAQRGEAEPEPCNTANCHGSDLRGGASGVSCDSCHTQGWRTDCNFCHEDSGELGLASAFEDHGAHVLENDTHVPFDCDNCHTKPTDVLSPGHMFDSTPGVAEVAFTGLGRGASWSNGKCSDLYCHGNGRQDGDVRSGETMKCDSCHGGYTNRSSWRNLSGEHREHLDEGVDCGDCHGNVATPVIILNPDAHVNGQVDKRMPSTITETNNRCSGRCHGEGHSNESW